MTRDEPTPASPLGSHKTIQQAVLETGAAWLQDLTPVKQFDIYVCGFHCAKDDPMMQMEAHHYCRQVNADLLQCVIFDGNTATANLIGIEYIISERLFSELPHQERAFWHPHNHELLSGTLVAPGLPELAEKAMFRLLMNSYGKTWHLWHTQQPDGSPGDRLPLGPAMLMWSFNREGEMDPQLQQRRDARMQIDTAAKRQARQDLAALAHPQHGVDLLKDAFAGPTTLLPGVRDVAAADDQ